VGFEKLDAVRYRTLRGEETRCHFCPNKCVRTFVDVDAGGETRRFVVATCEKGEFLDREALRDYLRRLREQSRKYPNFVELANRLAFEEPLQVKPVKVKRPLLSLLGRKKRKPEETTVGIPRVLNAYSLAPFFRAFFAALGFRKVVFSDYTDEELYRRGSKRGSIDPCFPSKVALAHTHQLLFEKECDLIFFPCVRTLPPRIENAEGHWACPTVAATPEVVKAAFTKERDEFALRKRLYLNPVLDFDRPALLKKELYEALKDHFGVSEAAVAAAVEEGFSALKRFHEELQRRGREVLELLEREKKVGILLLGRPYHRDPGIHHGIPDELHRRGYPIFTLEALPKDGEYLKRLFGPDWPDHPLSIRPVWPKPYSENSSLKVWGALFASRHPNLAVVDLSSFRCGHDAPIYSAVEEILESSKTPYFTFHELDENRPSGSIKIRVETIDYFLRRYEEEVLRGRP